MKRLLLIMMVSCRVAFGQEIEPYDDLSDEAYDLEEPVDVDPESVRRHRHHHYHPTEADAPQAERNSHSLSLNVPRHARRGLTATMSVRYRKIEGSAIVRVRMSPGLELVQAIPAAVRGPDGELLWFGVRGPMGSLKIKARIDERISAGTALLIHADLYDGYGETEHQTETIVVR
jgi:hypothetical protein